MLELLGRWSLEGATIYPTMSPSLEPVYPLFNSTLDPRVGLIQIMAVSVKGNHETRPLIGKLASFQVELKG